MSEVVVYTTIAVVYRVSSSSGSCSHQDSSLATSAAQCHSAPSSGAKRNTVATSASTISVRSDGSSSSVDHTTGISERAHSCSSIDMRGGRWRPIANGAWAHIHLFLEMDRDDAATRQTTTPPMRHSSSFRSIRSTSSSGSSSSRSSKKKNKGVLKNFRVVAWVLDTGKVIVNDVLFRGCKWEKVDASFRRFTGLDGQIYGFGFRDETQAAECSHVIFQILSNVKGECAP